MSSTNTTEPFKIFKYTTSIIKDCEYCMDNDTKDMTDAKGNEICCNGLRCMVFWPLYLVFDILSCPVRGCIHCKNKK